MIDHLKRCFEKDHVYYTQHARHEMLFEESGSITDQDVADAIQSGEILEDYPDDDPYPSVLIFGRSSRGRPLHVVVAYATDADLAIVITVYEPDSAKWEDFKRRLK